MPSFVRRLCLKEVTTLHDRRSRVLTSRNHNSERSGDSDKIGDGLPASHNDAWNSPDIEGSDLSCCWSDT
ncbi:hypothetical protein BDR04DRAFT_1096355 [Suillus decipiens]|nr:hypothetical protein BDR04DRAFT_1096355 [Suillus decipiens]